MDIVFGTLFLALAAVIVWRLLVGSRSERVRCVECGSHHVMKKSARWHGGLCAVATYQCADCGSTWEQIVD